MLLSKIFEIDSNLNIENLMTDSREKSEKAMFFCIKGLIYDAHQFVDQAIDNGAICIVHTSEILRKRPGIIYIMVDDVLEVLNGVVEKFYDYATTKMKVFAITGTSGKTTIAHWIKTVINEQINSGIIATDCIAYDTISYNSNCTTPDIVTMGKITKDMFDKKVRALAVEVSSHALETKRCDFIDVDVAIFTNLSNDHLDFHGSMDKYLDAKKKLFSNLKPSAMAIINKDDNYSDEIIDVCTGKYYTYGIEKDCDYRAINVDLNQDGATFDLLVHNRIYPINTNTLGYFNIYNLLACIAALHLNEIPLQYIIDKISNLQQVPGRMNKIICGQDFNVIVDLAHTPEGLEKVMTYARRITGIVNRLIVVIGAPGKKDKLKRSKLGQVCDKYCDLIILTTEDPRDENPADIASDISKGIAKKNYIYVEERTLAIEQAINNANKGDTVLILGKGDEKYFNKGLGKEYYEGDDALSRSSINERLGENENEN
ncbi:MAG: UDP-N-acetylmuramoyl-L-alanyl-D-glutamate--2,6-diaminopimelate ligase [Erysipelotrichaceae bacterium]